MDEILIDDDLINIKISQYDKLINSIVTKLYQATKSSELYEIVNSFLEEFIILFNVENPCIVTFNETKGNIRYIGYIHKSPNLYTSLTKLNTVIYGKCVGKNHIYHNGKYYFNVGIQGQFAFESTPLTSKELLEINKITHIVVNNIINIYYRLEEKIIQTKRRNSHVTNSLEREVKENFLSIMSHEIRTPLNGIVGMAQLLSEEQKLDIKLKKYISIIQKCSLQLMEIINNVLDFNKLNSGYIKLREQTTDIRKCIQNSIEINLPRANDKLLPINLHVNDTIPLLIKCDSKRLTQIMVNLLSNAIKFTEKGQIDVYVDIKNKDESNMEFEIRVKDTGIGIPKDNQIKIFDIFSQVNPDSSKGTGLGLSICKKLVELMGGEIYVESKLKKGSTFIFTFIAEIDVSKDSLLLENRDLLFNKQILAVDDNPDNRLLMMQSLIKWGIRPTVVGSASEALVYLQSSLKFDIIIIDVHMPETSGIKLAQLIREQKIETPLIGLSSLDNKVYGKKWFDYFMCKPVNDYNLLKALIDILRKYNKTISFSEPMLNITSPSPPNKRNKSTEKDYSVKILVAEDIESNQCLIKELLNSLGYNNIIIAENGKEAIDAVKSQEIDIVFMDIKMPIMDGITATKLLNKQMNRPPIIAVSASVLDDEEKKYYDAGIDGYLPKPISKSKLKNVLDVYL